jgi:two-component system alkaline phosphatase synthesis response regulator PhoP
MQNPRSGSRPRVLLVDDEEDILELLQYNLEREGFEITLAHDGLEAMELVGGNRPDLIVLDVMMPRLNGLETCRRLRQNERYNKIPVILLTVLGDEQDQVRGLNAGADIYLVKPISPRVLASQIRALLRSARRHESIPDIVHIDDLEIDRSRYLVFRRRAEDRQTLRFPRQQFELLHFLAAQPGKVFTREELLDSLWDREASVIERTVDVHVRKIREKIGSEYIETIKGVGYRFKDPA